jgi:hypothetical protein
MMVVKAGVWRIRKRVVILMGFMFLVGLDHYSSIDWEECKLIVAFRIT